MKMTKFGISHYIAPYLIGYLLITILLGYIYPNIFSYVKSLNLIFFVSGIAIFIIGWVLNIMSAIPLLKAYKSKKLVTNGLYKIVKNPMYLALILFTIPGLSILLNNWLILSVSIIFYILMKVFIKIEYEYLRELFKDEYKKYENGVLVKFL